MQHVAGQTETAIGTSGLPQFDKAALSEDAQCGRRCAWIDPQVLCDQPSRRRRDQATVAPLGIEGDVLEDEPHGRPELADQLAGACPDDDTVIVAAHRLLRQPAGLRYAAGGLDGRDSARRINQLVGIRF